MTTVPRILNCLLKHPIKRDGYVLDFIGSSFVDFMEKSPWLGFWHLGYPTYFSVARYTRLTDKPLPEGPHTQAIFDSWRTPNTRPTAAMVAAWEGGRITDPCWTLPTRGTKHTSGFDVPRGVAAMSAKEYREFMTWALARKAPTLRDAHNLAWIWRHERVAGGDAAMDALMELSDMAASGGVTELNKRR